MNAAVQLPRHLPQHLPADWIGWAVIIAIGFIVLRVVLRFLGVLK